MRIIKNLKEDDKSRFVSGIIDSVLLETGYIFFEELYFSIGEDRVKVNNGIAKISFDKSNKFIIEKDARATKVLLLQKI